jgi:hypothetical protein
MTSQLHMLEAIGYICHIFAQFVFLVSLIEAEFVFLSELFDLILKPADAKVLTFRLLAVHICIATLYVCVSAPIVTGLLIFGPSAMATNSGWTFEVFLKYISHILSLF